MSDQQVSGAVFNLVGLIMIVEFLLGLILNGVVIVIFRAIYKNTKTCTNLLILSISYCNLFHVLTYPLNIVSSFQKKWEFGHTACRIDAFWVHWMAITTISHLAMLSVDRYFTVLGKPIINAKSYKSFAVVSCWLYGLLWSVMPLVGWSDYELEGIGASCSAKFGSNAMEDISYDITLFIFDFFIPLLIITVSYIAIYGHLRRHNQAVYGGQTELSGRETAAAVERKLISIVITMVIAFLVAWTPYAIVCFIMMVQQRKINPIAATLPAIIAKSSACYFPIVYGFKHTAVQRGLRRFANLLKINQVEQSGLNDTRMSGNV